MKVSLSQEILTTFHIDTLTKHLRSLYAERVSDLLLTGFDTLVAEFRNEADRLIDVAEEKLREHPTKKKLQLLDLFPLFLQYHPSYRFLADSAKNQKKGVVNKSFSGYPRPRI